MIIYSMWLSLLGGIISPFLKKISDRRLRNAIVLIVQAFVTVTGLICAFQEKFITVPLTFADGISVRLASDETAKLFGSIIVVAWLLVCIYATVYMKHEKNEERFYLFMFLSEGAMLGAAFSENLISMYFFYELVTLFSMPLVLHSLTPEAVAAAKKYLFYSVAGAFVALFGIFVLSQNTTSLSFSAETGIENPSSLVLSAVFLMCLGFGAKAGLFPLHGWLASAHPVAPAPASALLSGVIAKAGVLAIIRTVYFVVGAENLSGTWAQSALIVLSLLTVFMGSAMAYREKIFKKRLAYSTVSQISYALCGIFMFSTYGAEGALWQVIFHAAVKVGLFLCAGAVIYLSGKTNVEEINGIGKKMPVTFVCFTVLSLSLIGIPPTGGFFSKWYLAQSALENQFIGALSWIVPVVLLFSALLTAGYLLSVTVKAFWYKEDIGEDDHRIKEPLFMTVPLVILSLVAVLGGIFTAETRDFISAVAATLF